MLLIKILGIAVDIGLAFYLLITSLPPPHSSDTTNGLDLPRSGGTLGGGVPSGGDVMRSPWTSHGVVQDL